MSGLERSTTSYRRQGSSGLVWDDKFLTEEFNQMKLNNQDAMMRRSRTVADGGSGHMYRTATTKAMAASPSKDPPSPKVSGCGFCGGFGKSDSKRRSTKRKS